MAAKPWLTTVIDDHSRAVAGYFLSFEDPSALHTSLALRQAIWRKQDSRWIVCGIPDVLYTDNGSDITSQHLEQVAADLKIRLVFSIPGKPWPHRTLLFDRERDVPLRVGRLRSQDADGATGHASKALIKSLELEIHPKLVSMTKRDASWLLLGKPYPIGSPVQSASRILK